MFSRPYSEHAPSFPTLPTEEPEFTDLLKTIGITLDPSEEPTLQLTQFAFHNWLEASELRSVTNSDKPATEVPESAIFQRAGMISPISPRRDHYSHLLLDGGKKSVYDHRFNYLDELCANGFSTGHITIFGGQALRGNEATGGGSFQDIACALLQQDTDPWIRRWLEQELAKKSSTPTPWERPFATEHEIAILALVQRYEGELRHTGTSHRKLAQSIDPSIPPALIEAEHFERSGQTMTVMNAPAVLRKFLGHVLPVNQARPTGKSCIQEWIKDTAPSHGDSALLVTHNPDIFRSWFDGLIALHQAKRTDIAWEGAGAGMLAERPYGDLLQSLGRLFVNYCYVKYSLEESGKLNQLTASKLQPKVT